MPSLLYTPVGRSRRLRRLAGLLLGGLWLASMTEPASAQFNILDNLFKQRAPVPKPGPSAPAVPGSMPEAQFRKLLLKGDLQALNQSCLEAAGFGFTKRLQLLQARLLQMAPAPQPLQTVLVNANALISCRAPDAALAVLNRYSPLPGEERDRWLVQRWRAAQAGLHHAIAAQTLEQLASGNLAGLEALALPITVRDDGSIATRPALDVYVDHLLALGRRQDAAAALLAGRMPGRPMASRLQQAVALLQELPVQARDQLLERALDQAAAAEAWSLAIALLDNQRRMLEAEGGLATRPRQRLERLSRRVDDAYSAWQLARQDPQQSDHAVRLQQQLRSPRAAGGHASVLPQFPAIPSPVNASPTSPQP